MKSGAHVHDQVKIRKMKDQGFEASEISRALNINKTCVKSFMEFDPVKARQKQKEAEAKRIEELNAKKIAAKIATEAIMEAETKK